MQSVLLAQVVLQDVLDAQMYSPQVVGAGVWQAPLLSQAWAPVKLPLEQEAGELQPLGVAPAARFVHVPGLEPLHVWQTPHEALMQHTVSTQVPVAHGLLAEQVSPNPPPLLHTPPTQVPLAQSLVVVQDVLQPELVHV